MMDCELYVKRYAKHHHISEEEAREHYLVKEYERCKKEEQKEGEQSES